MPETALVRRRRNSSPGRSAHLEDRSRRGRGLAPAAGTTKAADAQVSRNTVDFSRREEEEIEDFADFVAAGLGEKSEIALAKPYSSPDAGSFVTGQILEVIGGTSIKSIGPEWPDAALG